MNKVYSKTAVWIFVLTVIFPGSVLFAEDPPSIQGQAILAGKPDATTPVPPALHQALASSLSEAASIGAKAIPTPPTGSWGVVSEGDGGGGIFRDSDSEAEAWLGTDRYGVRGFGSVMGGRFEDVNNSGVANVGSGDYGISAYGNNAGGYFFDFDNSGYAYVGYGDEGMRAGGSDMGGYFSDTDDSGYAKVGIGDHGILAYGDARGGSFRNTNGSGVAHAGDGDWGIQAYGNNGGGEFYDLDSSGSVNVAYSTYKIQGTGTVSFVQNHPYDPSSVIVFAAPEGDEVATYTRGMARLVEGEATVPLGETFKWVTNPDIGLTVHLTPVGDPCVLYVVEKATNEITVRSRDGSDCAFDYLVYGLRIGFEESSIVQEKQQESYIPSMADHRQLYERRPDLKSYNSLERFKGMRRVTYPKAKLDLSRAQALRNAIIEFDPAVHELPRPPGFEEMTRDDAAEGIEGHREEVQSGERVRATRTDQDRRLTPGHSAVGATIPVDDEGNVYALSIRPSSQGLASLVDVSEEVQPGDVLVVDPDHRGLMRRGTRAADNGVVGIVAAGSEVVLGSDAEIGETDAPYEREQHAEYKLKAPVAFSGVVDCKVDASYGAVWTGTLLVTSPTPGHAMAQQAPLPGTVLGKALEPLQEGVGTIKVLVMLR